VLEDEDVEILRLLKVVELATPQDGGASSDGW
jgi:hypothetical protein